MQDQLTPPSEWMKCWWQLFVQKCADCLAVILFRLGIGLHNEDLPFPGLKGLCKCHSESIHTLTSQKFTLCLNQNRTAKTQRSTRCTEETQLEKQHAKCIHGHMLNPCAMGCNAKYSALKHSSKSNVAQRCQKWWAVVRASMTHLQPTNKITQGHSAQPRQIWGAALARASPTSQQEVRSHKSPQNACFGKNNAAQPHQPWWATLRTSKHHPPYGNK